MSELKAIGIIRRIDPLGRVVIPMETRRKLGIDEGDPLEIFVDNNDQIILKKYTPGCVHCGYIKPDLKMVDDKLYCPECRLKIWKAK